MRIAAASIRSIVSLGVLALSAAGAGAQSKARAFVRVSARDSAGAPVTGAELTVVLGIHDVLARGTTDDNGRSLLSFEVKDSTDVSVTMRKIGYGRADHFFSAGPHDTALVLITVAPIKTNALAPVKITAAADLKRKSYYLNADDIENFDRPLDNGWEVVKKLRPDMLTSRGGCATGVREIWVNGKRIRLPLPPTGLDAARARVGVPPRARFSYVPVSVMSEIAPEHIQEIQYRDCFDNTMAMVGTQDAMFVTLKPGVTYKQDVGSFVLDTVVKANGAPK